MHLRQIPGSATGKKIDFSFNYKPDCPVSSMIFFWRGVHRNLNSLPPTCLFPLQQKGTRSNTIFPQPQLPGYATVRVSSQQSKTNTGPTYIVPTLQSWIEIYTIDEIHDGRLKELSENPSWWTRHTGTYSAWNYCTICFLFSPKCTKIVGGWGSAPDPAGRAYSAPPDPLAVMG